MKLEDGKTYPDDDGNKERRIALDLIRYPADPKGYPERVRELEAEGLPSTDAQAVADAEFRTKEIPTSRTVPGRHSSMRGVAPRSRP
jgi:hypothetical protein